MRLAVGILLLLAVPAAAPAPGAAFKRGTVTLIQGPVRVALEVEVADTPETRQQGLMFRTRLDEYAGMLFVFESTGRWPFWMKNTLIPLSIAFIDEQWTVVDIQDMPVAPDPATGPFALYEPARPCRYALEVNQGFFRRHGIGVGARVVYRPR
ncbi:MAG: DUF192 domain-containing protein [Armatimonadota bacterium]|nr:DUF192 domain-containing protein [Armatimonadota bacterium]MDR7436288.1 DUF192 domain-containing protein [Armatimonadota bacterium]MDR7509011.1 DUF192 domain-containing protein [Armatimonadota bacterium]MDR7560964.1 DUF192 domain-containing protein [Armatimonadota bacterium]MDR7582534.1 DUF192 domain-containing protein [Armatimonadota bacterium]